MKKRLVLLLLSGMMLFGTGVSAYAAVSYGSEFIANAEQVNASSTSSTSFWHEHDFTLQIKAYNPSYTAYEIVSDIHRVQYSIDTTSKKSAYSPETYVNGYYTGRYFIGNQYCTITIGGTPYNHVDYVE